MWNFKKWTVAVYMLMIEKNISWLPTFFDGSPMSNIMLRWWVFHDFTEPIKNLKYKLKMQRILWNSLTNSVVKSQVFIYHIRCVYNRIPTIIYYHICWFHPNIIMHYIITENDWSLHLCYSQKCISIAQSNRWGATPRRILAHIR